MALNYAAAIVLVQSLISVAIQFPVMLICAQFGIDILNDSLFLTLFTGSLSPLATGVPALVYLFIRKLRWNDVLRFEKVGFFHSLLWVFTGLGICLAANYPSQIVQAALEGIGARNPNEILSQGDGWLNLLVEFIGVAVLVPLVEEFAFRGVIFSTLEKFGTGFAIAGSAVIFGIAHLNLSSVIFASIAGLGMAIVYAKTRNIWITVAIHALNNGISVIGSYGKLFGFSLLQQNLFQSLLMIIPVVLGTASFVALLIIGHRKKQAAQKEVRPVSPAPPAFSPLGGGATAVCLISAPLIWGLVVLMAAETLMLFL